MTPEASMVFTVPRIRSPAWRAVLFSSKGSYFDHRPKRKN
jgi:hypothetical protein